MMQSARKFVPAALAILAVLGLTAPLPTAPVAAATSAASTPLPTGTRIVAMRRLTEAQYRNAIADIFGPDVTVAGRFEPIVRPMHELIAHGAREASISPAGFEQFDAMARGISSQVFGDARRARFVPCTPLTGDAPDAACAAKTLAPLGRYLFRRPLTGEELALYVKLAGEGARPTGSFTKGLELALGSMMVSPHFLYVVESAEPDPAIPGGLRLDNYSRAARLSFVMWNTTPGEPLLQAAARGQLTDAAQLKAVADRMVASPRFEDGVRAFFGDMLLFEKFDEIAKDPLVYPYFNQDVARALPEQMLRTMVDHTVTRDEDYRTLFTTPRTFMNRPLAALYQVPMDRSDGWVPFNFGQNDDRAGLLGQAGFLALYSHSGRSSPTLRGRAIRELLLCQPVPNPPGNVNFTAVQDTANKAMPTARIRLNEHNTDPVCAGCHRITDPVGLSLERFDGIGAVRTKENDAPIDVSGMLDAVAFSGAKGLGKAMSASPDASLCVASRALEYTMSQGPEQVSPLVKKLEAEFAAQGHSIRALFVRAATMPEAWQVTARPLDDGATRITVAGRGVQSNGL